MSSFIAQAQDVTPNRRRASDLFNAVTGLRVGIDDPRVVQMETLLSQNKEREAVKVATNDKSFINYRMYNFARRLWSTTESYTASSNDFIATTVGVARDNTDVRELLTGNYYYEYDISGYDARSQTRFGPVIPAAGQPSNQHYESGFANSLSMFDTLKKTSPQMVFRYREPTVEVSATGSDPGGLLTTHSFLVTYAQAGTNRRMVEYTFRSFMCVEMLDWTDATRPDDMVGRDVDRFAGGGNERYQTTCKGCHAQMDAFRPAFGAAIVNSRTPAVTTGVSINKSLAQNAQVFPAGYAVTNLKWKNYATGASNMDRFGWRGNWQSGEGTNQFGKMISESRGFSRCMVRRMFYEVCKREATPQEEQVVRDLADVFEKSYKFRDLAEIVALNPLCLAKR